MLNYIDTEVITVHGRVALGLLAAEYVTPLLTSHPSAQGVLEEAIRADWSWMERRAPDPSALYWDYMPQLLEEDSKLGDDPAIRVLHCGLYAHTYAIWSAEGVANLEQPGIVLAIGNDIADVDESYLTQCLEIAISVSSQPEQTADWLNGLILHMEREQQKSEGDVIGNPLYRKDFTLPAIAP